MLFFKTTSLSNKLRPENQVYKTLFRTSTLKSIAYRSSNKSNKITTNYVYQIKSSLNHKGINEIEAAKQTCIELIIEKGKL